MRPNIIPFAHIVPMVYAYTTPEIVSHNGWTKIGYTEKQTVEDRIKQQTHTADVKAQIEWKKEARYTDGSGLYFDDRAFHGFLERFHSIERKPGTEWFKILPKEAKKLFYEFAGNDYDDVQGAEKGSDYTLRKEQMDAVLKTVLYRSNNKNPEKAEFLWNAKPRFGKTLSTYDFMRKINAKNVLIVTNRPSIANSWYEDFEKFIAWQTNYKFVSECDALSDRGVLKISDYYTYKQEHHGDARLVAFESLQGLKGSIYFGGPYDKLKWIYDMEWDLLVIDEAHEGVDTYKTDTAFEHVKRKFTLHLSGTPFKAIAKGKFNSDQIFNWSFTDEQEAKENWQGEGFNPYAAMPHMTMYTYQMSKIIQEQVSHGMVLDDGNTVDYAFDLNEFFSTKEGKFVYKKDVVKFLDALTQQERFPFSTEALREELKHTFWLMDRVDSCKAMAKLLSEHPVFKDYEVIVAAGNGFVNEVGEDTQQSKKSYDRVMEAIKPDNKTITLSVGQLTTGITVKPWTAVFMLSNMKSPAEYIQAAFRAQNPYKFEKDGQYYQKENCYVFDFSPERSLIVFEQFANSLYSKTANGGGTKEEREDNIKRLINFFSVYAEDDNGQMVAIDANAVMTIPVAIKADEVIKRGFMSNFLFNNLGNVFGAPTVVIDILKKLRPEEQQGQKNVTGNTIENTNDIKVDEDGNAVPDEIIVNRQAEAIFGQKMYEEVPETVLAPIEELFKQGNTVEPDESTSSTAKENRPEQQFAAVMAAHVKETVAAGMQVSDIKDTYGVKPKEAERITERVAKKVEEELSHVADAFTREKNVLEAEMKENIAKAESQEEVKKAQDDYQEQIQAAQQKFIEDMQAKTKEIKEEAAKEVVEVLETKKEEAKKRDIENDIRAHLRGFCRTIPSFIMAYGDDKLTLGNFETYPPDGVFEEVTSISVDEFKFLRDGGDYINPETGETEHYAGQTFDEVVFNESVQEFLKKKQELCNYFDEASVEDIFDYIPPQETNQIFTPKKVVKMMVDELESENPGIFDQSDKTFMDLYMKSGLYIAEIVKRLFRSPKLKAEYPDEYARLKHIMENQVYGLAPTRIILAIALAYIFGFDEEEGISRKNFKAIDATPYAKEGKLQELLDREFGEE